MFTIGYNSKTKEINKNLNWLILKGKRNKLYKQFLIG